MANSLQLIPITVFTGFLGSGKTTCIVELVRRLPKDYKLCLLKNEFGDVEVDSVLARETNIDVQEMLNGCMCCVLVGQMKLALIELKEKYHPDRIVIETSGSAFPAPIAWQIREMEPDGFILDSIVTVIDCVNFRGYEDTSYTAKMQAQYTDLILLNKWELISERDFDLVLDHINDLNTDTPKVKCDGRLGVSPDLMFGLDTQLFQLQDKPLETDGHLYGDKGKHFENEVDLIHVVQPYHKNEDLLSKEQLKTFLESLPKENIFRVKGLVRLLDSDGKSALWILNHAFGRWGLTEVIQNETLEKARDMAVKVTVMGLELRMYVEKIKSGFFGGINDADSEIEVKLTETHKH